MESYVVRIYRRDVDGAISGVVEDALSRRTKAFHSIAELSEWLRRPRRVLRGRTTGCADDLPAERNKSNVEER